MHQYGPSHLGVHEERCVVQVDPWQIKGFRVSCKPLIEETPSFKGLEIRIQSTISYNPY